MNAGRDPDDDISRADPATIAALVADLASTDRSVREAARLSLVRAGSPAVAGLVRALGDPHHQVRWEAAKALGPIADPEAAPALVGALEDSDSSVRWLAAEGLISLGSNGLVPLMRALVKSSESVWLRDGAHHVLHKLDGRSGTRLGGGLLTPVVAALEDVEPVLGVPPAAAKVLLALTGPAPASGGL